MAYENKTREELILLLEMVNDEIIKLMKENSNLKLDINVLNIRLKKHEDRIKDNARVLQE